MVFLYWAFWQLNPDAIRGEQMVTNEPTKPERSRQKGNPSIKDKPIFIANAVMREAKTGKTYAH